MFRQSYNADNRLEIIILGAMRGLDNDTSRAIRDAVIEILKEKEALNILTSKGITSAPVVTFPEEWSDQNIEDGVFNKLDTADLIIVNITPKEGKEDPTPNVFYELGLIHSLGIPYLLLTLESIRIPFYVRNTRNYRVSNFDLETLKNALRAPLYSFINDNTPTDFTDNVITRFFGGLPVIDISAAAGLATGYYMNFVRRLLKDDGFVSHHPDLIKAVIIVRPPDIFNTYQQDLQRMTEVLSGHGFTLEKAQLPPIPTDKDGALWFDHENGIVIDIPRTIYPLKKSPRLLSLRNRLQRGNTPIRNTPREAILRQAAEKLLDKIESIIRYHMERDDVVVRTNLLYFSTLEELPQLITDIKNGIR